MRLKELIIIRSATFNSVDCCTYLDNSTETTDMSKMLPYVECVGMFSTGSATSIGEPKVSILRTL